jgi:hypothetical protein
MQLAPNLLLTVENLLTKHQIKFNKYISSFQAYMRVEGEQYRNKL